MLHPHGDQGVKSVLKNCLAKSSCRSTATGWISTHSGRKHKEKSRRLCVASWNVRTLLDNNSNPERRSAVIAHGLQKYNIDIAALSETRVHGNSLFEEAAAGYTFSLTGHPCTDGPSQAGVGFAIRSSLLKRIESRPVVHNPRIMYWTFNYSPANAVTVISAYAPTLVTPADVKNEFYEQIDRVWSSVPHRHKLLLMGDFNACVGRDSDAWEKVLGKNGVGSENSNGTRLLSLCTVHKLNITNSRRTDERPPGSILGPVTGTS